MWAQVKTAFDGGIAGIGALILNWSPIGLFYQAFAAILNWFGVELPAKFTAFGSMLIDGLVNGIKAKIDTAVDGIRNMAARVKSAFASVMDIHSPSRVFKGYGVYITEGLAIGVNQGAGRPIGRISQLAGSLKNRFAERMGDFRSDVSARLSAHAGSLQ